jgi:CsoR family transcriptional regulator, copper-sensing transcriptional repressor
MPQGKKCPHEQQNADHSAEIPRLRRIVGQLEGVERMIQELRYCPEIIQQIRAVGSAVKALEHEVLRGHLASCILRSAKNDAPKEFETKLDEVLKAIKF